MPAPKPQPSPEEPEYFECCGKRRLSNEFRCPKCGKASLDTQLTYDTNTPLNDDTNQLGGVLGKVCTLEPGEVLLLMGPRGSGKSSLAFSAYEGVSKPWVVTSEMSPAKVKAYAQRLKSEIGGCSVPGLRRRSRQLPPLADPYDPPVEMAETEFVFSMGLPVFGHFPAIVMDSLTGTGKPLETLAMLRAHCAATGARAVVVSQTTTEGTARGGSSIEFDVDVVVSVEKLAAGSRRLSVEKSRNGAETSLIFSIGKHGISLPEWGKKAYSVEGVGPNYRIVPYPPPNKKVQFQAFLNACAQGAEKPAKFPFSVACSDAGKVYASRWQEPDDANERRAFSLAHGLPYYEPSTDTLHIF